MRSLLLSILLALPLAAQKPAPAAPAAPAATPAPAAPKPGPRPAVSLADTQLFHVVLLRASRSGTSDTEGLPKAALKAIDDLREFLPFKQYRLLDSQLVRAAHGHHGYVAMDPYRVRFLYERRGEKLDIPSFVVSPEQATPRPPTPGENPSRIAPKAVAPLISTAFQMDRGETIVVGSSRIAGDDALVVLLTAVKGK